MKNIYLFELSDVFANQVYLPYSVGILQSHTCQDNFISDNFKFKFRISNLVIFNAHAYAFHPIINHRFQNLIRFQWCNDQNDSLLKPI